MALQGIRKGQTPFGACIVKNGKVISLAHNRVWMRTDITAHAEIEAIRIACKKLGAIDLSDCDIYSTCEPCPMCLSACHWARISTVVYGARIRDAEKAGFNELKIPSRLIKRLGKSRVKIIPDFMRKENLSLFKEFAVKGKDKLY